MEFLTPPIPADEADRLAALRAFGLLDTPREPVFDDLVTATSALFDVPISLVTLVDENRQWFKACVGLDGEETSREISFCAHAVADPERKPFVVRDTHLDDRFRLHPSVLGEPYVRFYAGAPLLTPSGHAIGTLCAVDTVPREPTDRQVDALMALARQAMVAASERQVLDVTLKAACRTLVETLALANPLAFARANRVREIVSLLVGPAGIGDRWEVEVAAMLGQVGAVTLPVETLERIERGEALGDDERALLGHLPDVANGLLGKLPRLELVRAVIVTAAGRGGTPELRHPFVSLAAELIRAAGEVDDAEGAGMRRPAAAVVARDERGFWKPEVRAALTALAEHGGRSGAPVRSALADLELGQVLAADVRTRGGMLLVGRGQDVTPALLDRLHNYGDVAEPLWVHEA